MKRLVGTGLVTIALALYPGADFLAMKPYRIAAALRSKEGKWIPGTTHEVLSRGVRFQIRYLDPIPGRAVIERGLSRTIDLLPGWRDEKNPGFILFVLQLDNDSEEEIHFNPGQARLVTEKADIKFALDYTSLFEVAKRFGVSAPTLDEMGAVVFDRVMTLKPGGSVLKLLAFESPTEDRWRTAEVMIVEIQSGPEAIDLRFPFRKFEPAAVAALAGAEVP